MKKLHRRFILMDEDMEVMIPPEDESLQ